ncbi:hypothetical protein JCM5296_002735 [Sporobolomyces johnsonii]
MPTAPRPAPLPLVVSSSSHLPTPPSSSSPTSSPTTTAASVAPLGKRKRNRRHVACEGCRARKAKVCVYVDCQPVYPDESTGSLQEQLDEAHREIRRLQRIVDELGHVQEEDHVELDEEETLLSPVSGQPSSGIAPLYGTPHSHVNYQYPPQAYQQQQPHQQEFPQAYYDTHLAPPPALPPLPPPYAFPIPGPSSSSSSYSTYASSYPPQRAPHPGLLLRPPQRSRPISFPPAMPAVPPPPPPRERQDDRDRVRSASTPQPGSGSGGVATEQEREHGNSVGGARRGLRG